MSELMETILHRRSIRRFDERQVEEKALHQILEAGLYAPSAGGRQQRKPAANWWASSPRGS